MCSGESFLGDASGKEPACQCSRHTDMGSIPGPGRSPGEGNGNPLQYSCLENPMDRGAWRATVREAPKSQIWLKQVSTHAHALGIAVQGALLKYAYIHWGGAWGLMKQHYQCFVFLCCCLVFVFSKEEDLPFQVNLTLFCLQRSWSPWCRCLPLGREVTWVM